MGRRMKTLGRGGRWLLVGVGAVLLVSYGGAIVAAPVTVPLLFLAARSTSSRGYRVCAGMVVVLTIAEAVWAVTFLAIGEARPLIWLLPSLATVAGAAVFARMSKPSTL